MCVGERMVMPVSHMLTIPLLQLIVDTDSVVAFTAGVKYDVRNVGSCLACCCGGEGCYNTLLTGDAQGGSIWLQTITYEKLAKKLVTDGSKSEKPAAGVGGGATSAEVMIR